MKYAPHLCASLAAAAAAILFGAPAAQAAPKVVPTCAKARVSPVATSSLESFMRDGVQYQRQTVTILARNHLVVRRSSCHGKVLGDVIWPEMVTRTLTYPATAQTCWFVEARGPIIASRHAQVFHAHGAWSQRETFRLHDRFLIHVWKRGGRCNPHSHGPQLAIRRVDQATQQEVSFKIG
jgi:hypothetical protein